MSENTIKNWLVFLIVITLGIGFVWIITPRKVVQVPVYTKPLGCDCTKTCPMMKTCAEAKYQLTTCGCIERDGDFDEIPCEDNLCGIR